MKISEAMRILVGLTIATGFAMGLFLIVTVPLELFTMVEVRGWPSREGTVTDAFVTPSTGGGLSTPDEWKAEVRGVYNDTGEEFWISKVRYGDFPFDAGRANSREAVARYPVGTAGQVYFSPANSKNTVLEPFAPWTTMLTALGAGVGGVLLPVVLYIFREPLLALGC